MNSASLTTGNAAHVFFLEFLPLPFLHCFFGLFLRFFFSISCFAHICLLEDAESGSAGMYLIRLSPFTVRAKNGPWIMG